MNGPPEENLRRYIFDKNRDSGYNVANKIEEGP